MLAKWVNVLVGIELCISLVVVLLVPYTEIDWKAYMQEVKGFIDGELDYTKLQGDTGPLVYPGGFVWIFSALYFITNRGQNIEMAQWIFAGLYTALFASIAQVYTRSQVRGRLLIRLLLSRRICSLFVLRLFNDCWAMFILYLSILALANGRHWKLGCLLYSIAVSVKMNVLLFAPGLLMVLLCALPLRRVMVCLFICALWQILVALPFLLHDAQAYLSKAFELHRVFTYRWTVNFKCLPEEVFVSPEFGLALLVLSVLSWAVLWRRHWVRRLYRRAHVATLEGDMAGKGTREVCVTDLEDESYRNIAMTMMESNLIGVMFARSLHYQFFIWFYHSMPMVLTATRLPFILQIAATVAVQYGFEHYPSTAASSAVLLCGFGTAWIGIVLLGADWGGGRRQRVGGLTARDAKAHTDVTLVEGGETKKGK